MLVLLVAAANILALKNGTFIDPARLPCQPICLVSPSALSARLPCQPVYLVSPSALSARLPRQPVRLVSPSALSAHLPCQPVCPSALYVPAARIPA